MRYPRTLLSLAISLLCATGAQAGNLETSRRLAGVPKTGQTTCYNTSGTTIPCPGTGQDGDLQKGVTWPNPRFTDNTNGTVTDNLTGLIWLKNANCANAFRNWAAALADVANLNSSGKMNGNDCADTSNSGSYQTDWRLPNVRELQSLIDYGKRNLALPSGHPFSGVQPYLYWSSTSYAVDTSDAWVVSLLDGNLGAFDKFFYKYHVWPVRGGQ